MIASVTGPIWDRIECLSLQWELVYACLQWVLSFVELYHFIVLDYFIKFVATKYILHE